MDDVNARQEITTFGDLLRRLRKARRLTQGGLSAATDATVSERAISECERGITALPQPATLEALARALNPTPGEQVVWDTIVQRHRRRAAKALPGVTLLDADQASVEDPVLFTRITTLASAPYTVLPALLPKPYMIGRSALLAHVRTQLTPGNCIALYGAPGVGKSAFAIRIAHDMRYQHFHHRVLYAALGPSPDIRGILASWGAQLGIRSADVAATFDACRWLVALRQVIGHQRMLIILDDIWELDHFISLNIAGPNCSRLVTTRSPALASHIGGSDADAIEVEGLTDAEGMQLLRRLAPWAVRSDEVTARRLVKSVGGLPLALHLIGNYLRQEALGRQPHRIETALATLRDAEARLRLSQQAGTIKGYPTVAGETPISLAAIIHTSFAHLRARHAGGEVAILALRQLTVFPPKPSTFSDAAAEMVCAVSQTTLDLLYDYGFMEVNTHGRYMLHQVMHDYLRLQSSPDELEAAQKRLLAYFAPVIERHATDFALLTMERANIQSALDAALKRPPDVTLSRAVNALAPFLEARGEYPALQRLLIIAERVAVACHDRVALATAWFHAGRLAESHGAYQEARIKYEHGLAALEAHVITDRETDIEPIRLALLARCAELALRQENSMQAESIASEGLQRAQALGIRAIQGVLLRIIAQAAGNRGDFTVGDVRYAEALAIAREEGDVDTVISCLQNMGVIAFKRGRYQEAIALLQDGLKLAREVGHIRRQAALLNALGCVFVRLDATQAHDHAQGVQSRTHAKHLLSDCLRLATAYQLPQWQNNALQNLGALERVHRRFAQAEQHLQEAQRIADEMGDRWLIAETALERGELYLEMGKPEAAQTVYEQTIAVASEGNDDEAELLALAQFGLSRVWVAQGDRSRAFAYAQESLSRLLTMQFDRANEVARWLESFPDQPPV